MAVPIVPCGSVDIPAFDTTPSPDLGVRWRRWVRTFSLQASGRGVRDPIQRTELLLGLAGEGVLEVYDTLFPGGLPGVLDGLGLAAGGDNGAAGDGDGAAGGGDGDGAAGGGDVFTRLVTALNAHFIPQVNISHERLAFTRCQMKAGETVLSYATRLRKLASSCEFGNTEERIRDQIIEKVLNSGLRRKFLREGIGLTLVRLLEIAASEEVTEQRARDYERPTQLAQTAVMAIKPKGGKRPADGGGRKDADNRRCFRCNRT